MSAAPEGTPSAHRVVLTGAYVDDVEHVSEVDTIRACHDLAARGFLYGPEALSATELVGIR